MIKKIKENIILHNKFFKVSNDKVMFPNNKEGEHLKISPANNLGYSVSLLVEIENGKVALINNFRYAANKFVYQNVKGGNGTDFNTIEDALICAKEELEEEIGMEAEEYIYCGTFYETPSISTVKSFCFIAKGCKAKKERTRFQEDSEIIDGVLILDLKDIDNFLINNETCLSTAYLLTKYQNLKNK